MKIILLYISTLITLLVLDSIWLGVISKEFYKQHIGHLFRTNILWTPVIIFYLLYAAAIVYFAILPANGSWTKALLTGALLGFTAYMTYDLVNYSTLKEWPLITVIIDIAWGVFITASAATVATIIYKI